MLFYVYHQVSALDSYLNFDQFSGHFVTVELERFLS